MTEHLHVFTYTHIARTKLFPESSEDPLHSRMIIVTNSITDSYWVRSLEATRADNFPWLILSCYLAGLSFWGHLIFGNNNRNCNHRSGFSHFLNFWLYPRLVQDLVDRFAERDPAVLRVGYGFAWVLGRLVWFWGVRNYLLKCKNFVDIRKANRRTILHDCFSKRLCHSLQILRRKTNLPFQYLQICFFVFWKDKNCQTYKNAYHKKSIYYAFPPCSFTFLEVNFLLFPNVPQNCGNMLRCNLICNGKPRRSRYLLHLHAHTYLAKHILLCTKFRVLYINIFNRMCHSSCKEVRNSPTIFLITGLSERFIACSKEIPK